MQEIFKHGDIHNIVIRDKHFDIWNAFHHHIHKLQTFKAHINSLDFAVGSCFSKIFCMKSRETITECMRLFNCQSVKNVADKGMRSFKQKYSASSNTLCKLLI